MYAVVKEHGPLSDIVTVPVVQHLGGTHQSSSSIRSRRAELTQAGILAQVGRITTPSGRKARTFKAVV